MIINLTKSQQGAIKHLMEQDGWEQVKQVALQMVDTWSKESVKADTEFETMWNTATKESKCQILQEFFEELEKYILS